MVRRLSVALGFDERSSSPVGTMGWDAATRQAGVEWDTAFAGQPLALTPLLVKSHNSLLGPRGRAFVELPGLFGDSLPDGWGRLLIDRELAARGRQSIGITDMDRLAMIGRDGMGALTYRTELKPEADEEISLD